MSPVDVLFLGAGDAFGSGGQFQTCMLLRDPGSQILVDCGASSLIAMKRQGVDSMRINSILVSHLHGDHFGGIPFLILDGQFSKRELPLAICGPPGVRQRVEAASEVMFPGSSLGRRSFSVDYIELPAEVELQIGPASVRAFPVEHECGAPPYALRIHYGGRVITYSGDTAWTENLIKAARGADLFVCEAYFFDKRIPFHLDYQTLRRNLHRIECRRLILTHLSHDMFRHLSELEIEHATDGKIVTV